VTGEYAHGNGVVVDACVLLNLCASGELVAVVHSLGKQLIMLPEVEKETQWLRRDGTGDDREGSVAVDLVPFLESGAIVRERLSTPEQLALYVELAREVDDGEAAAMALAVVTGRVLATDDRKCLRVVQAKHSECSAVTTPELLRQWVETATPPVPLVQRALWMVAEHARYWPPRDHPLRAWWDAAVKASGV